MTKYIELDAAINACYDGFADCRDDCAANIKAIPAADVALVKHGRWLYFLSSWENIEYLQCSICKKNIKGKYKYKYCPHCGAKMDGGEDV